MNFNNRKNDTKGALIALGIIVLISVISSVVESGGDALGILIAVIFGAAAVLVVVQKSAKTKKDEKSREEKVYSAARPTANASCDYGELNCDYSHDYQRRVEQLNAFLKNGTIDKAEYNVLLERYRQNYEEHKD